MEPTAVNLQMLNHALAHRGISVALSNGKLMIRGSRRSGNAQQLISLVGEFKAEIIQTLQTESVFGYRSPTISSPRGSGSVPLNAISPHSESLTPEMLPLI